MEHSPRAAASRAVKGNQVEGDPRLLRGLQHTGGGGGAERKRQLVECSPELSVQEQIMCVCVCLSVNMTQTVINI